VDNRALWLDRDRDTALIRQLCDRKFGVGADGLILLQAREGYDFEMIYYNADGKEGSMCGNGGRCAVSFAHFLGLCNEKTYFLAVDGAHEATLQQGEVALKMTDVKTVEVHQLDFVLNTGSPHFVRFCGDAKAVDIVTEGKKVRYSDSFKAEGINVNFVSRMSGGIAVSTYERGVEDETLSCGTGVTASAIAFFLQERLSAKQYFDKGNVTDKQMVKASTKGGILKVEFEMEATGEFTNIWLIGAAEQVFSGEILLRS